jgi:RNA recognition motif-containing protein
MRFIMKLYVANLPNSTTEDELTAEFKEYGEITSLKIITDRETGRSRGFGFVEMPDNAARKAIEGLNDSTMQGRQIAVSVAQERRQTNRRDY